MTKKVRRQQRQQRRKDVLKKKNTTALLKNIHKPTTRHKWDSAKIQRALLSQIISEVGLFANTDKDQNLDECLSNIVASMTVINIGKSSMYRWYVHYQKYGEIPVVTATREGRKSTSNKLIDDEISYLKRIVNRFPQYYLDEIADVFHARFPSLESRKSEKDIWLCLTEKCNYRLKVYTDIALQRNEQERNHFRHALDLMITNPEQVILIDETARDKNSSRRRRIWALRGQKAEFNNIFDAATEEDYSMIGAADLQ